MNKKFLVAVGAVAASALMLAGCTPGDTPENPATGEPIPVAGLSGLTFFPEAPQAVDSAVTAALGDAIIALAFAIAYASAAIEEAEYAVLDASLARMEADDLAGTSA